MAPKDKKMVLPLSVMGKQDVGRLLREVETLNEFLRQSAIRQSDNTVKMPRTSRFMDEIVQINELNPLVEADRKSLVDFLSIVKTKAPVLHMSFNADPSPLFTQKLMTWLRKEIHPQVLLQTGLQPNIGAGCVVRTDSKYFDFSMRHHFTEKRSVLIQKIKGEK